MSDISHIPSLKIGNKGTYLSESNIFHFQVFNFAKLISIVANCY